jgi:hypothetical protein
MPDHDKLMPVDPSDLVAALAFALRYHARNNAEIVATPLVEHLVARGFAIVKPLTAQVAQRAVRKH